MLQIPDACLLSLHSAEKNEEFGKSLFGVVCCPHAALYHDAQDVVLALFLAAQQQQQQRQEKKEKESFYKPYLATLPPCSSSSSSNAPSTNDDESSESNNLQLLLPRQWSDTTLKRRLHGTSLYKRIITEQNGIKSEYELIKTAWIQQQDQKQQNFNSQSSSLFPTWEQYDNMMAAITSRGFVGLGYDGVDVMIPLLDLLNHVRGGQGDNRNNGGGVAHVRYQRYQDDNDGKKEDGNNGEPATKRIKTAVDNNTATINIRKNNSSSSGVGGVKVTAGESIAANETTKLQMTYGAKSNSTLLGRYGFCIANNVEPDGSCNDVLEIELKEDKPPVKLRRGPKSYTYGLFVKALQLFHDDDSAGGIDDMSNSVRDRRNCYDDGQEEEEEEESMNEDDGGMQAFLDDCEEDGYEDEEEEEGDDDLDDMMYNPKSFSLPSSTTKAEGMMNEVRALDALHLSLKQALKRCDQNSLICSSSIDEQRTDKYCLILIKSEMQTISFYMKSAEMVQSKLSKSSPRVTALMDVKLEMSDTDQKHINDLVDAFMTIRYPGVSI